ncbi:MAG: hypothetical protein IIB02_09070 [Thaumarchaeota archaeon]|nr:hypothetical protein [Nitrososphaerota archaeon]
MRPIGIIVVALSLGAILAIIAGDNSNSDETPWGELNCDEMLDFSDSDEHSLMKDSLHMEFHEYYINNCSDTEIP